MIIICPSDKTDNGIIRMNGFAIYDTNLLLALRPIIYQFSNIAITFFYPNQAQLNVGDSLHR